MDTNSELKSILGESFKWNKARLDCFVKMLLALFKVRTVNLREIAVAMDGEAQVDSRNRRVKRFFSEAKIDRTVLARWIFKLFFKRDKKVYLTIDRTNWFVGKKKINLLVLGAAYEGLAIPLFWKPLDKAGNATGEEHGELIEKFVETFGRTYIAGVLADREFANGKFFEFLNKQEIPFYIRIKEGANVLVKKTKFSTAKKLFCHLDVRKKSVFQMTVWIFGQKVYLAGSRSERGELMIVATNQLPSNAVAIYLRRWEIENLFQGLKSRGFRFESTHLTQQDRIEKLMVLLAVGFSWAHLVGEWQSTQKAIRFNKHRHSISPQYSFFHYGFELIRDVLFHINTQFQKFKQCLFFLKIPRLSALLENSL